jgi:hypothetical protein
MTRVNVVRLAKAALEGLTVLFIGYVLVSIALNAMFAFGVDVVLLVAVALCLAYVVWDHIYNS